MINIWVSEGEVGTFTATPVGRRMGSGVSTEQSGIYIDTDL